MCRPSKSATEFAGEVILKLASTAAEQAEIGYSLHPDAIGNGYVTEAATAMLASEWQAVTVS